MLKPLNGINSEYAAVVVIIDGCSAECLKRARTPFLDRLMEKGSFSLSCRSIYPTVTYAAHSSILTGDLPQRHGVVGNAFYDRESRSVVDLDEHDVNSLLLSKTMFETVEGLKVSIGEPVTRGAEIVVSKEEVQSSGIWEQDEYAISRAIDIITRHRPILVVINLPGMDVVCEKFGPKSEDAIRALENVDCLIQRLDRVLAEVYADHLLVILSDHGLTDVAQNLDLTALVKEAGASENDVLICPSHRFAHLYIEDPLKRERVKKLLESDERIEFISTREQLGELGLSSARSGDLVIFARGGYELGPEKLRGSHGGMTPEEVFVPLIVNKREYLDFMEDPSIIDVPKIALRYLREKKVEAVVKDKLRDVDPSHGWEHIERVLGLATSLAIRHGGDIEAIRLSALLHDSVRDDTPEAHVKKCEEFARHILIQVGTPPSKIEPILRAIRNHHTTHPERLETLEEKILWDADKLDALGLVGLARCLQEAGYMKKSLEHALNHLKHDVEELTNTMHFDDTRQMTQEKLKNIQEFIKRLEEEISFSEKSPS